MADIPRPLVIVDRFPLPAVTGGRQRMWNFLLAIDSIGPADLLILESGDQAAQSMIAAALPMWTARFAPIPKRRMSNAQRVVQILRKSEPSGLGRLDFKAVERSVHGIADAGQLIIAIQPIAAVVARRVRTAKNRVLVDLWDVEDARLARLNALKTRGKRSPRSMWNAYRDSADVRAWRRFHERLVANVEAVTACSDIDLAALPMSGRLHVVPNGADLRPPYDRPLHDQPVIVYHGQLTYPPNVDAARILVEEILPLVRRRVPDAQVRIVGRVDERVLRLDAPPRVTVTGFVDDIEPELAEADLLIVPLRVGGGTRLKILEAFSARLPVVSTTIGAEGLDVAHGTHLVIADDSADIASAAVKLLQDHVARERMTAAAYKLVAERYDWRIIRDDLADLIRTVL